MANPYGVARAAKNVAKELADMKTMDDWRIPDHLAHIRATVLELGFTLEQAVQVGINVIGKVPKTIVLELEDEPEWAQFITTANWRGETAFMLDMFGDYMTAKERAYLRILSNKEVLSSSEIGSLEHIVEEVHGRAHQDEYDAAGEELAPYPAASDQMRFDL